MTSFKQFNNRESFNNGQSFIGSSPPNLISNSRSNDYYMDRTGRNGILFNQLSNDIIYKNPTIPKKNIDYNQTIKQLEIYPEDTYTKCVSRYNPDEIVDTIINNDTLNTYLHINKGVLVKSKCYTTKSDC